MIAVIDDHRGAYVLDALEQALHTRRPADSGLIHHGRACARGVQYVSIRYTERLAEAGIVPSVAAGACAAPPGPRAPFAVGDLYDNAPAETVNGPFKTEVIRRRGPWRSLEAVEFATLECVDWHDNRRLLEPIGTIPPAEAEERHHAELEARAVAAQDPNEPASGKAAAVQSRRNNRPL
jgi:transposase InsO family protein